MISSDLTLGGENIRMKGVVDSAGHEVGSPAIEDGCSFFI